MAERWPDFTPVHLLTGFLGSGKTTLLRRLLADPALADSAVLINEFGEVGLDHHLLERIDERTVLLQSGCLCCTIRGELAEALRELQSRRERGAVPPFGRVVIESTGLADPFPILSTLVADPVLRHHFAAAGVVTTVDAVNGSDQLARHRESLQQVAVADHLVITKSDLADRATTEALAAALARLNPTAIVHDAMAEPPAAAALLQAARPVALPALDTAVPHGHDHGHDRNRHGDDIVAFALTVEVPIDWNAFGLWLTMLLNRHGMRVLRVKGILNVAGETLPVAVHGVQHLVHAPSRMVAWPDADRRSRLVLIVDGLDPSAIRRSFVAFLRLAVDAVDLRAA